MTIEEVDRRIADSTERMRQERLTLEAQNAELQQLVDGYALALDRLEAQLGPQNGTASASLTLQIKDTLRQLAERSTAVASAL